MTEMFTSYGPEPPPEGTEPPACVASYPEPCGEPAVGEGWGCLPLCEAHWNEAELAAREEPSEAVENELEILAGAEEERYDYNPAVVRALKNATAPSWGTEDYAAHDAALAAAFPPERIEGHTDPDTLAFDYDRYEGDGPLEWWSEECILLLRFLRQTDERGLPRLALELEGLRERATVQRILAEPDQERRWVAPRKAAREAKERAGG